MQDDPLEAFMAEINQTAQSEASVKPAEKRVDIELDEDADNVADFMEVRLSPQLHHPENQIKDYWRKLQLQVDINTTKACLG